jgi:hypothetical protein
MPDMTFIEDGAVDGVVSALWNVGIKFHTKGKANFL